MRIHLNKTAYEIMQDLIFESAGIDLQHQYFDFETPRALSVVRDWGPNTVVKMVAVQMEDDQIRGEVEILYRRLNVADLPPRNDTPLSQSTFPFTTVDLLPQINALFRTQMQASDIVSTSYADLTAPVVLTMAPGSLIYIGDVTLSVENPNAPQLILNPDLDGFANAAGSL
jgi:hypothetical protein